MVTVIFIDGQGKEHPVEAEPGYSVMEAAVKNGVPGIVGECGGYCACGTCVASIGEPWLSAMAEPDASESEMLEFIETQQPNARLTCQIRLTEELDGLIVRTPSR